MILEYSPSGTASRLLVVWWLYCNLQDSSGILDILDILNDAGVRDTSGRSRLLRFTGMRGGVGMD